MFTGIIEEIGTISSVAEGSLSAVVTIQASKVLEGSQAGDSIAVNGVCLTVTSIHGGLFTADVMAETLRRSSLGSLSKGSRVNLERAMHANGRFGGHIVPRLEFRIGPCWPRGVKREPDCKPDVRGIQKGSCN